ncbi:MAG: DUF1801 domain-containing protein [Chloroflexota bacterium]
MAANGWQVKIDRLAVPGDVDEYIAGFPPDVRERLRQVRGLILEVAPEAVEKIGYGMPTYVLHGNLVHFAAYKAHIGLYPTPSGTEAFAAEIARYRSGKGSIQFPLDEPLPLDLIRRIVEFRVKENLEREAARPRRRPRS